LSVCYRIPEPEVKQSYPLTSFHGSSWPTFPVAAKRSVHPAPNADLASRLIPALRRPRLPFNKLIELLNEKDEIPEWNDPEISGELIENAKRALKLLDLRRNVA
jgi:hypothetical protein